MRLQKILLMLVGSFLLVGGVVYLIDGKSVEAPSDLAEISDDNQTATLALTTNNETRSLSGSTRFKDLQTFETDLACELTSVSNINGAFSGKVYLSGGKVRGDFDIQEAGQLFASSMIMDGNELYFWTDTPIGKMSFKTKAMEAENSTATNSPVAMDEVVDYNCQPWTKDEMMFIPPDNLEFSEI